MYLFFYTFIFVSISELKEEESKKKNSGIGKFFKNVGIRKSGRKYAYKPHQGKWLKYLNSESALIPSGTVTVRYIAIILTNTFLENPFKNSTKIDNFFQPFRMNSQSILR